jgi:hypothetical protein
LTDPGFEVVVALAGMALKPTTNMAAVATIAAIFLNMFASPTWMLFLLNLLVSNVDEYRLTF